MWVDLLVGVCLQLLFNAGLFLNPLIKACFKAYSDFSELAFFFPPVFEHWQKVSAVPAVLLLAMRALLILLVTVRDTLKDKLCLALCGAHV